MSYDNRSKGVLFKNEDKASDSHPDYRGNMTLPDGTECWLDAWINESKKDGKKYMSLKLKPKMAREHKGASNNPPTPELDDSIPF